MMDYPCGKFGDCSFSRFGSIVWTDTDIQTHTDADECFTPTTVISLSNYSISTSHDYHGVQNIKEQEKNCK